MRGAFSNSLPASLVAFLAVALVGSLFVSQAAMAQSEILGRDPNGVPTFVRGDLGAVAPSAFDPSSRSDEEDAFRETVRLYAQHFALEYLGAEGDEELRPTRVSKDALGSTHTRLDEYIGGLRVYGAALVVHSDAVTGEVSVVNGEFVASAGVERVPRLRARKALDLGIAELGLADYATRGNPELCYVLGSDGAQTHLAFRQLVLFQVDSQDQADYVYADAVDGSYVTRHPTIHPVKSWRTYDGNNGSSLPGTLLCTNDQPCGGDPVAQAAHDNASATYDYYMDRFSRDSLNDQGMTLLSTVHHRLNYNNAFWDGQQMAYGDGDGTTFAPFPLSFDVVAHELTHGVTDFESDLIYQNESGALNEGLSDIFAAAAESWIDGAISGDTWKVGEDVYTPNTPGDALRYMDDPTDDGSSEDYWPERYTGSLDNGGVHWNSGIANLAFYLMVEGGTHPRGKTSIVVPAIGMSKAEQVFYRAQTTYLTASSNFQSARNATVQAAADLYGQTEVDAVHQAWCAVGVPGCPGTGPGPGSVVLENGVPENGLAGAQGDSLAFTLEVPSDASNLVFQMSGGSGDADLYVLFGAEPTSSNWDCRPYTSGNNENCSFSSPQEGTYYVSIVGYRSFANVTLLATFDEGGGPGPGGNELENGVPKTNLSGDRLSTQFFTLEVPASARDLVFQLSGGSGDADLYVRFGQAPTTSSYDCRPYRTGNNETCSFATPQAGTWHVMLRGYTAYSGTTLLASFTEGGGSCPPESGSVSGLSGSRGDQAVYTFDVPACASTLTVKISGGSGDADLYVRFGQAPTTGTWDCRPYLLGNNETCTIEPTQEGTYYLMVRAYSSYSGVTLTAEYE